MVVSSLAAANYIDQAWVEQRSPSLGAHNLNIGSSSAGPGIAESCFDHVDGTQTLDLRA
jgi:hypothetical protein